MVATAAADQLPIHQAASEVIGAAPEPIPNLFSAITPVDPVRSVIPFVDDAVTLIIVLKNIPH